MNDNLRHLVVFVPGFRDCASSWDTMLRLLSADERVTDAFELETFAYNCSWFTNRKKAVPPLSQLADQLSLHIADRSQQLTLVGHSYGSLVIESCVTKLIDRGQRERLKRLRQVILFATPNLGSLPLPWGRTFRSRFRFDPDVRALEELDEEIDRTVETLRKRLVRAEAGDVTGYPVPFFSIAGEDDELAPPISARRPFDNHETVDADHDSVIEPWGHGDPAFTQLRDVLLSPRGHRYVFEVERLLTRITVQPLPSSETRTVSHGEDTREVQFDNEAQLLREVSFAASNRCRREFTIRYSTRNGVFVSGTPIGPDNLWRSEEEGRWEDTGLEYVYRFRPELGSTEPVSLNVDVLGGFGHGQQDVHFHLGEDRYIRNLIYELDLSEYVSSGWAVSQTPALRRMRGDVPHSDLEQQRALVEPLEPEQSDEPGCWSWRLADVQGAVVDIAWEIAHAD